MIASAWSICIAAALAGANAEPALTVEEHNNRLIIASGGQPVARYIFGDDQILRPYFSHVHAPSGEPVTRSHPPRPGIDATDHDTMHPGIWLAFGDLSGADFWRNKGRVELIEFVDRPAVRDGVVQFVAKYRYAIGDRAPAREVARHTLRKWNDGWLITMDSELSGERAVVFGDQEEMGLGIRLATPLAVKGGSGTMTNSAGDKNEKGVWGKTAAWCDYHGVIDGRRTGMVLMAHPDNFRPSWMHARDYGLVVANPFGQRAFTGGEASRVEIRPGESLRLRFAVYAYATKSPDYATSQAYDQYLQIEPEKK
jgi:hypothetical protein